MYDFKYDFIPAAPPGENNDVTTPATSAAQAATPVPATPDTSPLTFQVDELVDGDSHNPYMHDHETQHEHSRSKSAGIDPNEQAAWNKLLHGIEAAIRDKGR